MSLRGLSVLALLCLAACTSTPVHEQPPPAVTPPSESPPPSTPPPENPPTPPPVVTSCTPGTCAQSGAQCGLVSDGCGDFLLCGGCAPGQVCEQGLCLACIPRTCEQALAHCGELSDGCGGTLRCDSCPSGQRCGEDRLATVCVAPGGAPPTAWVKTFQVPVTALATDSRANIVLTTQTPEGAAPSLFDSRGQLLWARSGISPRIQLNGLSVAPSGELLAWGWNHGESGPGGAIAYRFDALGLHPTVIGLCGDECGLGPYLEDAAGNLLLYSISSGGSRIGYRGVEGHDWSLLHSYSAGPFPPGFPQTPFDYWSAVFDSQGQVLVSATLEGQATFQGQSFGADTWSSLVVLKLSPQGQLVWARELPKTRATLSRLQTSGSGLVVGVGTYSDTLRWPGGELRTAWPSRAESFLMALDAHGRISWARPLPLDTRTLAVSPSGRIAVVSRFAEPSTGARGALHVREYDVQGNLRWSRTWSPLDASGALWLTGMAWAGEDLVLAGSFRGAVDFGTGVQQGPTGMDTPAGFVLELQRP
ncbi:hypothetical protein ATI61_106158 [Archangium gephyra]|uniref:Tryptophan synthase alpha chain n=1 Tax=Archangium gephyra TaxID=48 RepID=A0ABX9K070_9BACT|nr:hypothetical protein ATI61_106158 [Archangium gephyra]